MNYKSHEKKPIFVPLRQLNYFMHMLMELYWPHQVNLTGDRNWTKNFFSHLQLLKGGREGQNVGAVFGGVSNLFCIRAFLPVLPQLHEGVPSSIRKIKLAITPIENMCCCCF